MCKDLDEVVTASAKTSLALPLFVVRDDKQGFQDAIIAYFNDVAHTHVPSDFALSLLLAQMSQNMLEVMRSVSVGEIEESLQKLLIDLAIETQE